MTVAGASATKRRFGETARTDMWWLTPLLTFLGFSAFIVYSTWAAFQGSNYEWGGYLSPFYSPLIFGDSQHSWLGPHPSWYPWSPAFLILWAPGLFRFTCYYYRGAYYKSFWADPMTCAVGEPRNGYRGENSLPLILQNLHRYALYVALVFIVILAHDAWKGMWFDDGSGGETFGIGVGTLVLIINVILLGGYTFGCHSLRHLVGGKLNVFSKAPLNKKCWDCVTSLNNRHMLFAWLSLFWVGFSDLYVRMCSMGVWTDYRFF